MRLKRSRLTEPGLRRRAAGRGFTYIDADGAVVRDAGLRARLETLPIPPAWTDVWICADENGHIQAVGTDAAGRKQYLYHPVWRQRRDLDKFDRMVRFGARLPAARRTVTRQLSQGGTGRTAVLAAAFRMLDSTLIRVGGEQYAKSSGAVGLATVRRSAVVACSGEVLALKFEGKSAIEHELEVHDRALVSVVRRLVERDEKGDVELLAYDDGEGWRDVRSSDVNDHVRATVGDEFTAKDFRTWHATVTAAAVLLDRGPQDSDRARRRVVSEAMQTAASRLGNTPAVARSSYVDPRLIEAYHRGVLLPTTRSAETIVRELLSP
ncbi:MAG TPA: DNA topoisomerase IB [Candidatus Nanopelagicales bacterium]|nr:DNA topoisomerase IB [Candidatus Nanopelagicales bacterium]